MQVAATNYAKKKVLGRAGERLHQNRPAFETDAEIIAATEEAQAKQKRHWWRKDKKFTPDMLLSKRDQKILHRVKTRAWYLDKGFHCCCFNVGVDGIVGLIPGIGDFIGTAFALQLVKTACKADLPKELIMKMMVNVVFDFFIGLTPVAGDILDIMFKANWRNAMLLEEYLIMRRRDELRLEKGEAAAAAIMDQPHPLLENGHTIASSSTVNPAEPAPVYDRHHNEKVGPIITEVDDEGNAVVDDTDTKDKKKYGTFFGKWKK